MEKDFSKVNKLFDDIRSNFLSVVNENPNLNIRKYLFGLALSSNHYTEGYFSGHGRARRKIIEGNSGLTREKIDLVGALVNEDSKNPVIYKPMHDTKDAVDEKGYSVFLDDGYIFPDGFDDDKYLIEHAISMNRPEYCFFFLSGCLKGKLNGLEITISKFVYYYEEVFPKDYLVKNAELISYYDNLFDETGHKYKFVFDNEHRVKIETLNQ